MKILAWPKSNNNPYIDILYRELEEHSIKVYSHRELPFKGVFKDIDIFHFHWLNSFLNYRLFKSLIAVILFILYIEILKIRKIKIVWTLHNFQSHHLRHPILEKILTNYLYKRVDRFIIHSEYQRNYYPERVIERIVYIKHHNYLSIINKKKPNTEVNIEDPFFLVFGTISSYKDTLGTIELYNRINCCDKPNLLIIGKCFENEYKEEIKNKIANNDKITYIDRFFKDEELNYLIEKSFATIFKFKKITNSGSLILALSNKSRVYINDSELIKCEFLEKYKTIGNFINIFDNEIIVDDKDLNMNDLNEYLYDTNITNVIHLYLDMYKEIL